MLFLNQCQTNKNIDKIKEIITVWSQNNSYAAPFFGTNRETKRFGT